MMLEDWSEDSQARIAHGSALIVGVGGLGSPVALYLAAAGVGRLGLVDPDVVSITNLQRQILYSERELGKSKVLKAADRLASLNSDVEITVFPTRFDEVSGIEMAREYDVIVDCTDNYATRFAIDAVATALGKPWVYGAISGLEGQISVMNAKSAMRFSSLFPEREALVGIPASAGAVAGPCPGVVGSIQALEALTLLSGRGSELDGKLLVCNLKKYEFYTLNL